MDFAVCEAAHSGYHLRHARLGSRMGCVGGFALCAGESVGTNIEIEWLHKRVVTLGMGNHHPDFWPNKARQRREPSRPMDIRKSHFR